MVDNNTKKQTDELLSEIETRAVLDKSVALSEIETEAVPHKFRNISSEIAAHNEFPLRHLLFEKPTDARVSTNIFNENLSAIMSNPTTRDKIWFAESFLPNYLNENFKDKTEETEDSTGLSYNDYYDLYNSEHIINNIEEGIRDDYVNQRTKTEDGKFIKGMTPEEIDRIEKDGKHYASDIIKKLRTSTYVPMGKQKAAGSRFIDNISGIDRFGIGDITPYLHDSEKFEPDKEKERNIIDRAIGLDSQGVIDTKPPREAFTNLGKVFYDELESDKEYKQETIKDFGRASGQIHLFPFAIPSIAEDLVTMGEEKLLGEDKAGWFTKAVHSIPAIDTMFDISRTAFNFSNSEIFEKKALFKDNPTLDFTYGMWGILNQISRLQIPYTLGKKAKQSGGMDLTGNQIVSNPVDVKIFEKLGKTVKDIEEIIYADKVFLTESFSALKPLRYFGKRRRAMRRKTDIYDYTTLGPYGYKQKLINEHFWSNTSFLAGSGMFQYGHNNYEPMANAFDTTLKEEVGTFGSGILGIIASGLMRRFSGYASGSFEKIAFFSNPTKDRGYDSYLKEINKMTDDEIRKYTTSQKKQIIKMDHDERKAHLAMINLFEHTRKTDIAQYEQDVGFAQAVIDSNRQLIQWAEDGLGRPLTREEQDYFSFRMDYALDSGVLAETNNAMREQTNLGVQAKLPKGTTLNALRSDWQERMQRQAQMADLEVKALKGIFKKYAKNSLPPRVFVTMKQYINDELVVLQDHMKENARRIEEDARIFKQQYASVVPVEGIQERLRHTDIELPDPDLLFTKSRLYNKLLENNLNKYSSGDIATESDALFTQALHRGLEEKNKAYAEAERIVGSKTVSLEDPILQDSFNNIRLRRGVPGDEQISYTKPENIVESGQRGLTTGRGIASEIGQKGTLYNLKDIYFNAQMRILSQYKQDQKLLGLQRYLEETYKMNPKKLGLLSEKVFRKKQGDVWTEVNYLSLNATELEAEIVKTINSPVISGPGEITISDLNKLEQFFSREAFNKTVGMNPDYDSSRLLYESANDINHIVQAATEVEMNKIIESGEAWVINPEQVIEGITTYKDASNVFYNEIALPFRRGIGKTGTEEVAGGDYKVARSDLFMQFVKADSPYEAKMDFNRIFPEGGALREQAVSLLNANIARAVQDGYVIKGSWIDSFKNIIGTDTVNDLHVLQGGLNAKVIDERKREATDRVKESIALLSETFVDRPTELADRIAKIKGEDITLVYKEMKDYSVGTINSLVEAMVQLPNSKYDLFVDDYITQSHGFSVNESQRIDMKKAAVAEDLLGAYTEGFLQDNVEFGNIFLNKKEVATEGYKSHVIGLQERAAHQGYKDFREVQLADKNSTYHYLFNPPAGLKGQLGGDKSLNALGKLAYNQHIIGQKGQKFLDDQGAILNALANYIHKGTSPTEFTDNLSLIMGQGKLRETVNQYTAKALGKATPTTLGSILAKVFAVLRGVVSMKWILTDTTIRAIQRNRLKTIGKIVESPALAATLVRTLQGESLTPKDMLATAHFIRTWFAIDSEVVSDEELVESLQKVIAPEAHIDRSFLKAFEPKPITNINKKLLKEKVESQ